MLAHYVLIITSLINAAVLPSVSRPRTAKLSRGPVWTDFRNLAIDDQTTMKAKQLRTESRRLAVVAIDSQRRPAVEVMAELIRSGLMYGKNLIVTDLTTTTAIFDREQNPQAIRATAKNNGLDLVILLSIVTDTKTVQVEVMPTSDEPDMRLESIQLDNLENAVLDAAIELRIILLQRLNASPIQHAKQISIRPQASFAAIEKYLNAKQTIGTVMATKNIQHRQQLCREAIDKVNQVIADAPDFLEAYLLKTSCQDELNEETALRETLTIAVQKYDFNKHDLLTHLELTGDEARFVQSDALRALESYQKLLDVCPGNLTALWAIIDILLAGDGIDKPDKDMIQSASQYAAMIVACHPQSAVAQAISP